MADEKPALPQISEADMLPLFQEFDAAAEAEMSAADPDDFGVSRARLRALIDKLPQRRAIASATADRWLDRTMRVAAERMILELGEENVTVADVHKHVFWHIRRASGIGGSEVSTVVKHYRGERGTWGDANTLVKEKLLILSPQPSTDEMARGVRAEPWIQKMFHEKAGTRSDTESLDKLRNFRWERNPAGIGTPDDISITFDNTTRKLHDFKAPSAEVMKEYDAHGISFDYVCQLHHYEIIARAAGVKFHGRSIEALDPRVFVVKEFPVEFDMELAREITTATRRIWIQHVMIGNIPAAPKPEDLEVKDSLMQEMAVEMAMLKVLGDDITARMNDLKEQIAATVQDWHDVATGKIDALVGSYSRDRTWNEEALVELAKAADIDVSPFYAPDAKKPKLDTDRALEILTELHGALVEGSDPAAILEILRDEGLPYTQKFDAEGLAKALEDQGVSLASAMGIRETFRLSTKKKQTDPEVQRLSKLREDMSQMGQMISAAIRDGVDEVINAPLQSESEIELAAVAAEASDLEMS